MKAAIRNKTALAVLAGAGFLLAPMMAGGDLLLIGGGLANGLLALRLSQVRPDLDVRIVEATEPVWLRIGGYWYPRGGIPIDVFWQTGEAPKGVWLPEQGVATYRGRG